MKWSDDAERMLSKAPFFVRRRVRERVEEEAVRCGEKEITTESMFDRLKKDEEGHLFRLQDLYEKLYLKEM